MVWENQPLKIHQVHAFERPSTGAGVLLVLDGKPAIGTGDGVLVLDEIQLAGKKPMSGEAFLRGARHWVQP